MANLTGWEFKLFFLNSILNCTGVTEGPFLKSIGSTYEYVDILNGFNSTHGRVLAVCVLLGTDVSANGNGDLATITFRAIAEGDTILHLQDVKLSDEKNPPQPIPKIVVDGTVQVSVLLEQVLDVYTQRGGIGSNASSDAFAPGETIYFNASVRYQGSPVQGIIVQFITYDPLGTPTARTAVTDQDGIATLNTTLPSKPISGSYLTFASANTHGKDYNDTVAYKVGYIINIIQAVTCNCNGTSQTQFPRGTLAYFNITLENISFNCKQLFLSMAATDSFGETVAQEWINNSIPNGETNLLLGFRIPPWTIPGDGRAFIGAYSNPPWAGGIAYCPGIYAPLPIVGA